MKPEIDPALPAHLRESIQAAPAAALTAQPPLWKFALGDMVMPVVMSDYAHATRMVVTARGTEEYADHTERYYVCSNIKLGDYVRQRILESEIVAWDQK